MESSINHDQIFENMKRCFRESGFCIIYDRLPCGRETYGFRSLVPGLPDSDIRAWYDPRAGYVNLAIEFPDTAGNDHQEELRNKINDLNRDYDLFHFIICPDCGALEMRSGLYVHHGFPEEKFKRLLMEISAELLESVPEVLKLEGEQTC